MTPKRARTRAALIEATLQVLREEGLHKLSLAAVAAKAGVTTGAVYDNFPSKDAMLADAIASLPRDAAAPFLRWPVGRKGTVKQRLRRLAKAILAANAAGFSATHAEFLLYAVTHEEFRSRLADGQMFAPLGGEEQVLGLFAPDELPMSPAAFAALLNALIPGLIYGRILTPARITDELVLSIFEGLAGWVDA